MNQNQLNTFITVARYMNFSEAARELYLSQPTVSHQISSLEKELGTSLFIRESGNISLTKSGKSFLEDAKGIVGMTEDAIDRVQMLKDDSDLSLSIAYLLAPCHSFLPDMINNFRQQYPQVNISIHRMNAHEITQTILSQRYDLFFSIIQDMQGFSQYSCKTIFSDTMCMVFPYVHSEQQPEEINYSKLASKPFLVLSPEVGPCIYNQAMRIIHSKNFYPSTIRQLDSFEEILFEVEAGFGYSILPKRNQLSYQFPVTYVPLDGIYSEIEVGVAWATSTENPAVSWFLELLDPTPPPEKFVIK